jgi:phosphatidylserine/phosphatidylglycerophosphate/cardiolipin synthase-like enzyme
VIKPLASHLSRLGIVALSSLLIVACSGGQRPNTDDGSFQSTVAATSRPAGTLVTATPRPAATTVAATVAPTAVAVGDTTKVAPAAIPSWLKLYFTDPKAINATASNGVDQVLLKDLNAAKTSIDIASFDFEIEGVITALAAAQKRGVSVRLILDLESGSTEHPADRNRNVKAYDSLPDIQAAKIPYVDGGRSSGLMHNKIVIIDKRILYTGSWNISYNDTIKNNNNILRITNRNLIENYQAKFDEGFVGNMFGRRADLKTAKTQLTIDGVMVENYFSPADTVVPLLVQEVKNARRSIQFMVFTFTHADIRDAIIERAKLGVQVEGVIEARGASQGALPGFFCAGLPIKTDGNGNTMHHKVMIIDKEVVITGSFNFTKSANDNNDENIIIIRSKAVAQAYLDEFAKMYSEGKTPTSVSCN